MHFKTQGLVLRETEYKDHDKLLTVLTRDRGRLTLKARGVKSRSSRLKSGCQLLAFSEFSVFENRGYCIVQEAVPLEMFVELRSNLEWLSLTSYFAQVAELLAQEDAPNASLLSLTLNAMYALSKLQKPQMLVKAVFELSAACLAGYTPALEGCVVCGRQTPEFFSLQEGVLRCAGCREDLEGQQLLRLPVSGGVLAAMRFIVSSPPNRAFSFKASDQVLKALSGLTEAYLSMQLEHSFSALDFYKSLLWKPSHT